MIRFKLILAVGMLTACLSCAQVSVNYKTGNVSYTRWGDQQINGLEVLKDGDKIRVKMEHQQAQGQALSEAISIIKTLTVK